MAIDNAEAAQVVHWRIDEWFPDLGKEASQQLKLFHGELLKFNRNLNLISAKTIFHADLVHFADSILASRVIMKAEPKLDEIYDLGSGNGFPGIVFATLFPKVKLVLVDSDERKCEFLKHAVAALSLRNTTVKIGTIETLPANSVKYCMSRGLSNISRAILTARRAVPTGGSYFHLKGDNWSTEVGEIPTQLCSVWSPSLAGDYKLPIGEFKLSIVRTDKIS